MKKVAAICTMVLALTGNAWGTGNYDPYSIMNQAKQVEIDQNNRANKRRQRELDQANRQTRNRSKEQQRLSDKERCERYKSYALSKNLSGERKSYYRKMAAEYCR